MEKEEDGKRYREIYIGIRGDVYIGIFSGVRL